MKEGFTRALTQFRTQLRARMAYPILALYVGLEPLKVEGTLVNIFSAISSRDFKTDVSDGMVTRQLTDRRWQTGLMERSGLGAQAAKTCKSILRTKEGASAQTNNPMKNYGPFFIAVQKRALKDMPASCGCEAKKHDVVCEFIVEVDAHYCTEYFGRWKDKTWKDKTWESFNNTELESCVWGGIESPMRCGDGPMTHRRIQSKLTIDKGPQHKCGSWYSQLVPATQAIIGIIYGWNSVASMKPCFDHPNAARGRDLKKECKPRKGSAKCATAAVVKKFKCVKHTCRRSMCCPSTVSSHHCSI